MSASVVSTIDITGVSLTFANCEKKIAVCCLSSSLALTCGNKLKEVCCLICSNLKQKLTELCCSVYNTLKEELKVVCVYTKKIMYQVLQDHLLIAYGMFIVGNENNNMNSRYNHWLCI